MAASVNSTNPIDKDHPLVNEPDPARLIHGLRDMGYNLNTAAADIIDNSIAANASIVEVELELRDDGRKFVYFGDDGHGMSADQLWDAMRYGAPKRQSAKSLGKFGLGLKTASSAICIRYTVISKAADSDMAKLSWDLEHVSNIGKWEMLREVITDKELEKFRELCGQTGTLVIWSKCDKLLNKNFDEPGGLKERSALKKRTESLREHVAKIFHKYIDSSEDQYPNVTVRIGGETVEPWNPFYPERSEQVLPENETVLQIESLDGTLCAATLKAWILPHSNDMTKEENDAKAKISNRRQGFYIYREGRLIFSEGWMNVFGAGALEPHFSLIRVEFCFNHDLDEVLDVPVDKSSIRFDPALEDELKKRLQGPRNEANRRSRRIDEKLAAKANLDHSSSNKSISKAEARTTKPSVETVNAQSGEATLNNNRGNVKIKAPVQNNVAPAKLYIEEADDIFDGNLWEPCLRSTGDKHHTTGVRLNKHHPFYPKVYLKSASNGHTVEGIDFLLWALSTAEFNNSNEELKPIFADLREEISSNLKKLLDATPMPDSADLASVPTRGEEEDI